MYIGWFPGIAYWFISQKIYFLSQFIVNILNFYFIHVHSSKYRIAVLQWHVFLVLLTDGYMNL